MAGKGCKQFSEREGAPRLSAGDDLFGWATGPTLGRVGILTLMNVNYPTLTSNSTTLGWGTLGES